MAVVRSKNISPSWSDIKTALLDFDCAGLRGLVQDLYTANKDNQAFLHARLGLGQDQLGPFKASISRWISPDLMKGQPISVSKSQEGGAVDLLLRGSIRLFGILQHGRRKIPCCFDPHVWTVSGNRI
jgi:hypothetical protein